ncbi:hypothetical protein ACR79B_11175 [Sphingobacterium spiritivorum]|uniref:hypothetical protein n=1 Tax=Sphingobacterium spiritivorum TaxID=258 RepID=UPI003DA64192
MERSQLVASFPLLPTDDTIVYKATASITEVLQAFQSAFTVKAGSEVKFELEPIPLHHVKIDELISPDEIMPSWLGFLASNNLNREEWPIVRWIIEILILGKYHEDLEMKAAFSGEKGAIVPGTATTALASMNGVRKMIRDAFAAGKTNQIVLGVVPSDPVEFCTYVENFVEAIPQLLRDKIKEVSMSTKLERLYRKGVRLKYNENYLQKKNTSTLMDDEHISVKGYPGFADSKMIYATPDDNKANPMKAPENQGRFDVQRFDRTVKLLSDWWIGLGFWYYGYVFHNDQDLV